MARKYRLGVTRRLVNMVITRMVLAGRGSRSYYLLTTTGRKTRQERTTPVMLLEEPTDRWLVAPYGSVGWVCNVRAAPIPTIVLRRGSRTETVQAEEVSSQVAGPVLRRYLRSAPITAPFFDARAADPVERFVAEADRHPVFRLGRLSIPVGAPGSEWQEH